VQNILVDAGPIIAWLNRKDSHRARVKPFLDRWRGNLLTTWPVVTEASAVLPVHLRIPLMEWVERGGVQIFELPGDAAGQLGALMSKYQDYPMDLADASLVWLAGEIGVTDIITVDDSDFAIYRTVSGKPFRNLLPARRK
jgi:predicted nucleic acid-binding protein